MSAMEFLSTFVAPTYLFLFINLIIGTIYVLSRLSPHSPDKPDHAVPLGHTPSSLLHRDLPFYKPIESHPESDPVQYHPTLGLDLTEVDRPPLSRTPSFLERFRSINFYQNKFEHPEQEPEPVVNAAEAANAPTTSHKLPPTLSRTSSLLDQLKSISFGHLKDDQKTETVPVKATNSPTLARAPSFLERMSSIKFSAFYNQGEPGQDTDADDSDEDPPVEEHGTHVPARRIRLESERMGEEGPKPRMRKTTSENDSHAETEGIDAKADDFIQRFRQQLRLQRLDSIKRYKDMLTSAAH
ncbi:hypothetical protein MLD38_005820 [Melastoma candidum]|uniref:Uncharacterized protein n=1 Tax=Melastoma candidum TaxID=119954 RepID=A0ACB9RKZ3_9MYRT|nr:hypothetical protein MLD38_005820 [Melastoma candidum]